MATFTLTRQIPIDESYDLVICGGGPAGTGAAIAAGRLGAKVLLLESTGCLGGMGTSGLVTAFDPMANGAEMLVGGIMKEIVETLYRTGGLQPGIDPDTWRKQYMHWTPFHVESYKLLLDKLVTEANVTVRFFTRMIDVDMDAAGKRVKGIIQTNIEGYRYVPAKTFVDSTGDAILAHLAGARCREAGRDTPRIMPATLPSLFTGMDWDQMNAANPRGMWHTQDVALKQALADGHFTQPDRHLPGMSKVGQHIGYLNGGHMFNLNALRCESLSHNVMLGRRLAREYLEFYRKYVPGCEHLEHVTTASLIGVRESRRVVGEYELNIQDYQAQRMFDDAIGLFNKFVDIHPYDCSEEAYQTFLMEKSDRISLKPGEKFSIPYRIMVPKGFENLWVAGRTASSDVMVHGVIRVQPAANMMGQAAGTAAVQSIHTKKSAAEIDIPTLLGTLRQAGAKLPA